MTGFLIFLIFIVLTCLALCMTEWLDTKLDDTFPSYSDAWTRAGIGDPDAPRSNVVSITHRPCRFCHCTGFHDEGCSHLDRLHVGEVTR